MSFTGRIKEQKELEKLYKSTRSEFLAIYGRRRVGKTQLIKHFFKKQKAVYFQVTGVKGLSMKKQISRFTKTIGDVFYDGIEVRQKPDWLETFDLLTDAMNKQVKQDEKIILFMDEFPWMASHRSKLLEALDYFWNRHWSDDPRIKLVICGSSASWIIKKIINNKGGLHNRITKRLLLKPFTLDETKEFLNAQGVKLNHWQIAQIYMATGGIPHYLSFVEKGLSSSQVIESMAFTENAPLLTEFDNLFSSLFEDAAPYIELLRTIAKHRYGLGLSEIIKKSKHFSKGGSVSNKLKELKEAGFILSFTPYKNKKKGIYYRVIDEYTLFYFYWVEPVRNTLQEMSLEKGYWQACQKSPAWQSWSGYAFEAVVYKHLSAVRKKLNIPVTAIAGSWRYVPRKNEKEDGAQIDVLFDRADEVINIVEIKLTVQAFVIDKAYSKKLVRKRDVFIKQTKTQKQIFISMVCAFDLKDNPYSDALIDNVATLDDLFS